jgi:hypothetical protein
MRPPVPNVVTKAANINFLGGGFEIFHDGSSRKAIGPSGSDLLCMIDAAKNGWRTAGIPLGEFKKARQAAIFCHAQNERVYSRSIYWIAS